MAHVQHGDTAAEIDVASTLDVPEFGVQGPVRKQLRHDADAARDAGFLAPLEFGVGGGGGLQGRVEVAHGDPFDDGGVERRDGGG